MSDLDAWYEARQRMVQAVVADLYGTSEDDELDEEPLERYIVGILHPRDQQGHQAAMVGVVDEPPDGEEGGSAPDAGVDPGVSFAHRRYPSSMGLTVGLTDVTRSFTVEVEAHRYEPLADGGDLPSGGEGDIASRSRTRRVERWRRASFGPVTTTFIVGEAARPELPLADGLALRVVQRPALDGVLSVTVVLVNTFVVPESGRSDAWCWFRPRVKVSAVGGELADRRPRRVLEHMDTDEHSGELLYRRERHLAVGHGVSVTWEEAEHVTEVETTFFPEHDLRLALADRDDVPGLSMSELAVPHVREPLDGLVDRYESWIDGEARKLGALRDTQAETARRHLDDARIAARRMREGIDLLDRNEHAERAFRAMNTVMQQQRVRQEMIRRGLTEAPTDVMGVWRPFQMAFILLNLRGLAEPASRDRELADVLWFPTGGGKTEAYLGLIAFNLVHRRLRGAGADGDGAGVGVLMRYTLRLLTLQQFERAAGLICALEVWRSEQGDSSTWERFSIGLWVGQGATPNKVADAAKAIRKRRAGEEPGDLGDPVQLLRCPWCGSRLGPEHYDADAQRDRMTVRCAAPGCRFAGLDGLPVHLVDSDVYGARPSLVIGTVDKFAMLAWNEQSGRLFGSGHDAPPDLIVQDELHLISGPLGTLVGLYETAIDHLATDRSTGARPKVVASTATIRRAGEQVAAVFAREARQFPPPGVDADDSFFAVDAEPAVKGTRKYVGLLAPSTSHATLLVRTYAALLQGAKDLDAPDTVRDAYWTLLGYFNSLRVLGAAYIQSIDDVRDRIKVVAGRSRTPPRETSDPRELTSRKKSTEIPQELEALQTPCTEPGSPDIVLATNMISVGVDVDRLGLMAVMGQPQTTSEYIQATSRVGRRHPGLVLAMYNASRSRDLSHYESFTSYHRSLYKQVEATGATPFASRAMDRGLHGLLVILARHLVPGAAGDKSAEVPVESGAFPDLIDVIAARAEKVAPGRGPEVRDALESLLSNWKEGVGDGSVRQYARWGMQSADLKALMVPAGSSVPGAEGGESLGEIFPPTQAPWPTLTSLRNVDRESTLKIISSYRSKGSGDNGDQ
ncbi:helicase-related protein [Nocardioides sp. CPCC 205120]|uniref:helicase-related protein n=1 Tax=Nocardioides sp. CPCC 205120 TaxID=3406462 RepID=UPI003B50942C